MPVFCFLDIIDFDWHLRPVPLFLYLNLLFTFVSCKIWVPDPSVLVTRRAWSTRPSSASLSECSLLLRKFSLSDTLQSSTWVYSEWFVWISLMPEPGRRNPLLPNMRGCCTPLPLLTLFTWALHFLSFPSCVCLISKLCYFAELKHCFYFGWRTSVRCNAHHLSSFTPNDGLCHANLSHFNIYALAFDLAFCLWVSLIIGVRKLSNHPRAFRCVCHHHAASLLKATKRSTLSHTQRLYSIADLSSCCNA